MTRKRDRLYEMTRTLTEVKEDIASLEGERWGGRMEVSGRKWVFYIGIICILFSFLLIAIYYYQPNMDFLWDYLNGWMCGAVVACIIFIALGLTWADHADYAGVFFAGTVIFFIAWWIIGLFLNFLYTFSTVVRYLIEVFLIIVGIILVSATAISYFSPYTKIKINRLCRLKEKLEIQAEETRKHQMFLAKKHQLEKLIEEAEKRGINAEKEKELLRELRGEK